MVYGCDTKDGHMVYGCNTKDGNILYMDVIPRMVTWYMDVIPRMVIWHMDVIPRMVTWYMDVIPRMVTWCDTKESNMVYGLKLEHLGEHESDFDSVYFVVSSCHRFPSEPDGSQNQYVVFLNSNV